MALLSTTALAQHAPSLLKVGGVKADGSVTTSVASIPYSAYASPQARAFFPQMIAAGSKAPPLSAPIAQSRDFYDRLNSESRGTHGKALPGDHPS